MHNSRLSSADDIDKIAKNILLASKAWGMLPTPIDKIVQYADLQIAHGVDLSRVEPGFITANFQFVKQVLSKVVGIVDFRQKTIYLDHSQNPKRKNFVKLHEVGHNACSWQSDLKGFLDDDKSLDPSVEEEFEREASYFASGALFQLERFDDEAAKLPLCLRSAQVLGNTFGGSNHASLRRYVERTKKRCALLVLHKPATDGEYAAGIRDYFQSSAFTADFGDIQWPKKTCGLDLAFVQDIKQGRKWHENGQIGLALETGEYVTFKYHYFRTPYQIFILIMPVGEKNNSRISIVSR
jgi:hypothetical protein